MSILHTMAKLNNEFEKDEAEVFMWCAKNTNTLVKNIYGRTCLETALCQDGPNVELYIQAFGHKTHKMEWIVIKALTSIPRFRKSHLKAILSYYSYGSMVSSYYLKVLESWISKNTAASVESNEN